MEDDAQRASHGGRASSWLAVTVIVLGFAIGGVGLCLGPMWPLFWMGAAVCVLGGILLLAFQVFRDVVLDAPRVPYRQAGAEPSE
ncbi:HGxxPAAW family protein [Streptosporangium roseum]|uniref:HGxxPAAW family protein n=1 Tax=Streptosporangium roseum TaxID=2001 RepID=UPI003319768D